mmetsp:Transcript_8535/g.24301  ORF Transcript_8535/g.24301 Transcript_8535/m.24301 type:complete len:287 (-) Transcript_8535:45-905(-)
MHGRASTAFPTWARACQLEQPGRSRVDDGSRPPRGTLCFSAAHDPRNKTRKNNVAAVKTKRIKSCGHARCAMELSVPPTSRAGGIVASQSRSALLDDTVAASKQVQVVAGVDDGGLGRVGEYNRLWIVAGRVAVAVAPKQPNTNGVVPRHAVHDQRLIRAAVKARRNLDEPQTVARSIAAGVFAALVHKLADKGPYEPRVSACYPREENEEKAARRPGLACGVCLIKEDGPDGVRHFVESVRRQLTLGAALRATKDPAPATPSTGFPPVFLLRSLAVARRIGCAGC